MEAQPVGAPSSIQPFTGNNAPSPVPPSEMSKKILAAKDMDSIPSLEEKNLIKIIKDSEGNPKVKKTALQEFCLNLYRQNQNAEEALDKVHNYYLDENDPDRVSILFELATVAGGRLRNSDMEFFLSQISDDSYSAQKNNVRFKFPPEFSPPVQQPKVEMNPTPRTPDQDEIYSLYKNGLPIDPCKKFWSN